MSLILGSFNFKQSYLAVVPGLLVLAGVVWAVWHWQPRPMHFDTLEQFSHFAREHGLFVHPGHKISEVILDSFFVADRPPNWDQISTLPRFNCGQTAGWKGIVWVGRIGSPNHGPPYGLAVDTIGGHVRIWGELVTAGDPELLDRLEELHCRR